MEILIIRHAVADCTSALSNILSHLAFGAGPPSILALPCFLDQNFAHVYGSNVVSKVSVPGYIPTGN